MTEETRTWLCIAGMLTTAGAILGATISNMARERRDVTTRRAAQSTESRGLSAGFHTLRTTHAARGRAIDTLERQLRRTLGDNAAAVLEAERIAAQTGEPFERVKDLLDELVTSGALRRRYLALCPKGLGASAEANTASSLPKRIECERCGGVHTKDATRIEEVAVSTEQLQRELADDGAQHNSPERGRNTIIKPVPNSDGA